MGSVSKDVVVIKFRRSVITGRRIIIAVRITGSARPCTRFLVIGSLVLSAERCLLSHGFSLVVSRRNVLIFER
jgi:hypothetical protein